MVGKVSLEKGGGRRAYSWSDPFRCLLKWQRAVFPSYPLYCGLISLQDTPLSAESGPTLLDYSVWLQDPTLNFED